MKQLSQYPFFSGQRILSHYELTNGLRILLLPDASTQVVAYQTWFRVGSRHERLGKTGIAHLFEHLMFNESENLRHGEFDRLVESKGGHTNASTWVDWTCYQTDVPFQELHSVIGWESERMARLVLREPQLESEREVVMNERRYRVEDDIDGFLAEELFRLAFQTHPYHWPTIGFMNDIQAITLEDAQHFYRTYYAPNQATLVIVGNFSPEDILGAIEQHYGSLEAQQIPPESIVVEPAQTQERRAQYVKSVQAPQMLWGYKAPSFQHPDHMGLQLLCDILLGGPSSRLYRQLVVEKALLSSANAFLTPFRDPGLFQFRLALRKHVSLAEVEEEIEKTLQEIILIGPHPEEVTRSQSRFLTGFYQGLRTSHGKAEALGEYEIVGGDYRLLFQSMETFQRFTAVDIQQIAEKYLRSSQRTIISAVPSVY